MNRKEHCPISSILETMVSITRSDAAHLYWMDPATYELRLVGASSTLEDCRIPSLGLELGAPARRWLEGLEEGAALSAGDQRFSAFPEIVATQVAALACIPLRAEHKLIGGVTLSRKDLRQFDLGDIETAAKLGAALVAATQVRILREKLRSSRQENTLLERRLAERKLVERAKGLLQNHYGWTEEDAYYHLRRTSRQQRTPMAVIAQRVIDVADKEIDRERLSA
ncbi:MAG TPA: ANTAR domain-containing protein [Bryobacteraceae bacterium]|jgi:GAF domain-containing protein